ncbi:MAG: P-loop NTPase [Planctomycetota bacterium]|nr:P-loop NTPase [Planctomycetota bacterium]
MSEVNQAYLRAYLKNRLAQPTSNATSPNLPTNQNAPRSTLPQRSLPPSQLPTTQNNEPERAVNAIPRPRVNSQNPPERLMPSGESLRMDPNHGHANLAHNRSNTAPITQPPFSQPPLSQPPLSQPPVSVPPSILPQANLRHGIWTPHGVERGMKAMEPMSVPAVVQNGVSAVAMEASQHRRPTSTPPQQITRVDVLSSNISNISNHWNAKNQYDQVMYVDGLGGHSGVQPTSSTRPIERTLAEITEPIAFGTGLASASSPASKAIVQNSTLAQPATAQPATAQPATAQPATKGGRTGSTPRPLVVPTATPVNHRIDPSHSSNRVDSVKPMVSAELPPAPTPSKPSLETQPTKLPTSLPLPVSFAPSWEVDSFLWPDVVKRIEVSQPDAFHQIGKNLSLANRDGLKVMAITSGERGVGRSTVAMHMARCAAKVGLRVALIDGDTFSPSLINQLSLDIEHGWQDCLFENVPLHEVAVHSINDGITLFPLTCVVSQQQVHANLHRLAKLIKRISTAFDMVFIDANRLSLEQRDMVGVAQETIVDAAIVVVDTELSVKEKVDSAVSILQEMGLSSIGLVENFQSKPI